VRVRKEVDAFRRQKGASCAGEGNEQPEGGFELESPCGEKGKSSGRREVAKAPEKQPRRERVVGDRPNEGVKSIRRGARGGGEKQDGGKGCLRRNYCKRKGS